MAVVAIEKYEFSPADSQEKFNGNQVLYIGWEDHLMFCAPFAFAFPPTMIFKEILDKVIPDAFGYHPETSKIDWSQAEWFKSGKSWKPDVNKSLVENGLKHKDVLRFKTPGLKGIKGSCS